MIAHRAKAEQDLYRKLWWLILFRAVFAAVMLGSAVVVAIRPDMDLRLVGGPIRSIIFIALAVLVLSAAYAVALNALNRYILFAYFQVCVDTLLITLIIFVTGGFSSIFSFLYLVVIVYATMVIYQRGGMVTATLCSIQYGVMVDLEYYGLIRPFGDDVHFLITNYDWPYVIYKLLFTIAACYAVAFLSGFLSEQERSAKRDLWAMEDQVKRMEQLAAVGEMAAGLAHEIKNPLASLTGSIQMLKENLSCDPDQERLMQIVIREAGRLSTLVTDFLMFARPGPAKAEVIRLDKAISDIVALFASHQDYRSRIEMKLDLAGGLYVNMDPEHFRQVLWNLLNNAAEAIESKGRILVRLFRCRKNHACIEITDNGCGIGEETMASVFDPFFSTKARGTGLGLSIVQQVVGACGGLVNVESSPGKGTTVTIRLREHAGGQVSTKASAS